jgi:hypothetical protein
LDQGDPVYTNEVPATAVCRQAGNDDAMKMIAGIIRNKRPVCSFSRWITKYKTYLLSLFLKANNNKLLPAAHDEKNIRLPYFPGTGAIQLFCANFLETAGG